jgi:hypothetical protein
MNHLILGTADKTEYILEKLEAPYLLIDDGSVIDRVKGLVFDPKKHCLNPLNGMNYRRARDFISLMGAIFPEGANTLTRKNSDHFLLKELLKADKLSSLIKESKDPAETDASQKIEALLLSPVLKRVLTGKKHIPLTGVVLARLNRKELGDWDCFVLAHLLISQYKGTVVITDGSFYLREYLSYLVTEDRLITGVDFLSDIPERLQNMLLKGPHEGHQCSYDDAKLLATYDGLAPHTVGFNAAVEGYMA